MPVLAILGLLLAMPAPAADQVLVLKSGQALRVHGFRVDGAVVRIVGTGGEAYVIGADKVDLEASAAASRRIGEAAPAAAIDPDGGPAPGDPGGAHAAAATLGPAADAPHGDDTAAARPAPRRRGGFSVAAERAPTPVATPAVAVGAVEPAATPEPEADEDAWRRRADEARARVRRLEEAIGPMRSQIQTTEDAAWTLGLQSAQGRLVLGQLEIEKQRLKEREAELERARRALADLQEEARRAGVPPGWLR